MPANISGSTYELLDRAVRRQRLSHALLFVGPDGMSMQNAVKRLASTLLCKESMSPSEALPACGKCSNCVRIAADTHPNLRMLDVANTEIKIDQIRELKADQRLASFEEGAQFWLIPKAHLLNVYAANALLKTLEEPQVLRYLVLMAPSQAAVMPTLVSRCQIVRFAPALSEASMLTEAQIQAAQIVEEIPALSVIQRMQLAESLAKDKDQLPDLLNGMLMHILCDVVGHPFERRVSQRQAATAIETVLRGIKGHLNVQLLLETLLLQDWPR